MATTQLFRLLPNTAVATGPNPGSKLSANAASVLYAEWQSLLLDPAMPVSGSTQQTSVLTPNIGSSTAGTYGFVFGRWLTRPLPAQTISSGNWLFTALLNTTNATTGAGITALTLGGCCLAQWRPSTGAVIARVFDSPTSGQTFSVANGASQQIPVNLSIAGSSVTLQSGDCLALEVWGSITSNGTNGIFSSTLTLQYNGTTQWGFTPTAGTTTPAALTLGNGDAVLIAPAAVTYS